jgi:hypothetical protein
MTAFISTLQDIALQQMAVLPKTAIAPHSTQDHCRLSIMVGLSKLGVGP